MSQSFLQVHTYIILRRCICGKEQLAVARRVRVQDSLADLQMQAHAAHQHAASVPEAGGLEVQFGKLTECAGMCVESLGVLCVTGRLPTQVYIPLHIDSDVSQRIQEAQG